MKKTLFTKIVVKSSIVSILFFFTLSLFPFEAIALSSNDCTTAVGDVAAEERTQVGCSTAPNSNTPGTNNPGGGPPGPCQQAPVPPGDIRSAIINKWGITLNIPQYQLVFAWQEFHEIDCTGFLQAIRGTVVGSWGNGYAQQFSCPQDGEIDVMFSSQWGGDFMKAILVHELAHVWQFCSAKGEQNRLEIPSAVRADGQAPTLYGRTGCQFNVNLTNENHADTIALYLNPDTGELTCGGGRPNPFLNGAYPAHRGVAQRGVGR